MRFRKLRIAVSVTCFVLCLPLIVLWVCSYFSAATAYHDTGTAFYAISSSGGLVVIVRDTDRFRDIGEDIPSHTIKAVDYFTHVIGTATGIQGSAGGVLLGSSCPTGF
jgi:hypothetical protein